MNAGRRSVALALACAAWTPVLTYSRARHDRGLGSFEQATAWLNSGPLGADDLRGKVVLVDFWTYSCINWIRTLPWLRAWEQAYGEQGLVIIGVHTPEFEFEKEIDLVRRFVTEARIDYPIAIDSDYAIWSAFGNEYWPALYLVDAQGRIRHHRFGEGEYDLVELKIQRLLHEAGATGVARAAAPVKAEGVEAAADWGNLKSPEAYVGYARAEAFKSTEAVAFDTTRRYSLPMRLGLNQWALSGEWTVTKQFAVVGEPGGRIVLRFHARDLHLVMGAARRGSSVRFRVLIDGRPPASDGGIDVDGRGYGAVAAPRLYQLIRQRSTIGDRYFEIEFIDAGAEAYAFTFG